MRNIAIGILCLPLAALAVVAVFLAGALLIAGVCMVCAVLAAVGMFVLRVLALLFVIGGTLWLVGAVIRGTCSAILPNGTRCAG